MRYKEGDFKKGDLLESEDGVKSYVIGMGTFKGKNWGVIISPDKNDSAGVGMRYTELKGRGFKKQT